MISKDSLIKGLKLARERFINLSELERNNLLADNDIAEKFFLGAIGKFYYKPTMYTPINEPNAGSCGEMIRLGIFILRNRHKSTIDIDIDELAKIIGLPEVT